MRIVSLCPSLTELVFDLGRGADLVGVTRYCIHPRDGVSAIEKVGGTKNPDVARIRELAPDVVLLNEEENRLEDARQLQAAGIHCVNTFPRDALETARMVRQIGRELGRDERAGEIATDIEERCEEVRRESRSNPTPTRFAYLIWRTPWMSVNNDTYASALLTQAGGENVFGGAEIRYPEFTLEQLAGSDPELVLLCTEPFHFEEQHCDELASLTGIDRVRIRVADGELLSWHGSRTPAGVDYAAALIREAR